MEPGRPQQSLHRQSVSASGGMARTPTKKLGWPGGRIGGSEDAAGHGTALPAVGGPARWGGAGGGVHLEGAEVDEVAVGAVPDGAHEQRLPSSGGKGRGNGGEGWALRSTAGRGLPGGGFLTRGRESPTSRQPIALPLDVDDRGMGATLVTRAKMARKPRGFDQLSSFPNCRWKTANFNSFWTSCLVLRLVVVFWFLWGGSAGNG